MHSLQPEVTLSDLRYARKKIRIRSFEVASETLNFIKLPIYTIQRKFRVPLRSKINVLGECLALFDFFYYEECIIWVMEEYGRVESWTTRYKIEMPCSQFVYLEKNDQLLLINGHGPHGLLISDAKDKNYDRSRETKLFAVYYANVYVESLILLNETHGRAVSLLRGEKEVSRNKLLLSWT